MYSLFYYFLDGVENYRDETKMLQVNNKKLKRSYEVTNSHKANVVDYGLMIYRQRSLTIHR